MMRRHVYSMVAVASIRSYTDAKTVSAPHKVDQVTNDSAQRVANMNLAWMVREFEFHGHREGTFDPLKVSNVDQDTSPLSSFDPSKFGFSKADLDCTFNVQLGSEIGATLTQGKQPMKLRDIVCHLKSMYCSDIGFEFIHTGDDKIEKWFRSEIQSTKDTPVHDERKTSFREIVKACGFEKFLHTKYSTHKRFGLDGAESLIPAMNAAIDEASKMGMESCVIGMPHRGRLNVLVNVCGKDLANIFNEFEGRTQKELAHGSSDVKYHQGIENTITMKSGKIININLLPNPSHLEAVNPLVLGKTAYLQHESNDDEHIKHVPILLHGDAAFSGQGVCYETMTLCDLENFHVGGCIHIVVNNRVGFTTNPEQSRSAIYCSDLAKVNNVPVIHVNGDNVDEVVRAAKIAARFRQTFKRDIVIDLVCYRRYGHNESDVPTFTQPLMYKAISTTPVVVDKYSEALVKNGVFSGDEIKSIIKEHNDEMKAAHSKALGDVENFIKVKETEETVEDGNDLNGVPEVSLKPTAVPLNELNAIGTCLVTLPSTFKPHPKAQLPLKKRADAIETGNGVEWGLAEGLAFVSMAKDGINIRVTGQDVERGTFSHRHAVMTDCETNEKYCSMRHVSENQANIVISNSCLSEYGVCGFETGYSLGNFNSFVMWEAQFGDFANGAQIIFDQFLSCGEDKWFHQSPLTISLPHGYDGQGPEHSSSRVERFLQAVKTSHLLPSSFNIDATEEDLMRIGEERCSVVNWQVCYPSTPASYFHMLRRQIQRDFRKPLVFCFAKSGVRAPNVSAMSDMAEGTSFKPVIVCPCVGKSKQENPKVRKVLFCSGHIERKIRTGSLETMRKSTGNPDLHDDVVFVKLEQIAPFPWEHVSRVMCRYRESNPEVEFFWIQEECKNMGIWSFIRPRFNEIYKKVLNEPSSRIKYIGRPAQPSPACGHEHVHNIEEKRLAEAAFQ